jgi:fatty acid desaturase
MASNGPSPAPAWHSGWLLASPVVHLGAMAASVAAWERGWWPVLMLAWGVTVWMNHVALTRLHEAAHGALARTRLVNEVHGIVVGTAALIPLSVYRYVHARHHAHLGGPRDPEFWPYSLPAMPRWVRVGYAWLELTLGWLVTPLLYSVRTGLSWASVSRGQRQRVLLEWGILIGAWATVLWAVSTMGWIEPFVIAFVVPAFGAGVFQTFRKFIEHLGMHGDTIQTMTRSVVYRRAAGRLASASQLHVDHHGTHHRHARIPYYDLPGHTERVYGEARTFASHWEALVDMLPSLLDPKVGPQWRRDDPAASARR